MTIATDALRAQEAPAARAPNAAGWGGTVEISTEPARRAPKRKQRPVGPNPAQSNPQAKQPSPPGAPTASGWQASPAMSPSAGPPSVAPQSAASAAAAGLNVVSDYRLTGTPDTAVLTFELAAPVDIDARSLTAPDRVIIDLTETAFHLAADAGKTGEGLVKAFRFGLIDAGRSRIVIDTARPAKVERAEVLLTEATGTFQLVLALRTTGERELAARALADAVRLMTPAELTAHDPPPLRKKVRPVVVIDPGHGGIDPGAVGKGGAEKDVVLAVAKHVWRSLSGKGRYEVIITRNRDVFVSLDERVRVSSRNQADLFVSIHADSLPEHAQASSVRGATVYTLAERASDELARRMAEKENAVDLLAGLPSNTVRDDQVRTILIDLMRRETHNFSKNLQETLVGRLRRRVQVARSPMRSGPFKVLRQAGSPAVLIELGYMSHPVDERLMLTERWQLKVAEAIASAIDAHLSERRQLMSKSP